MRVLLAPDAGPGVGLGHLQRCLALAAAVRKEGAACTFVLPPHQAAAARVRDAGFPFIAPRTSLAEAAAECGADTVVVDDYRRVPAEVAAVRAGGARVAVVDDRGGEVCADVVVNPAPGADPASYCAPPGTRLLLGPAYALLREEYWALPPRAHPAEARTLLLTMGGADSQGLVPRLVTSLVHIRPGLDVVAVLGPFAERQALPPPPAAGRCRVVASPASLRDFLVAADLVVSAAGQTLHEAAATGAPTVAVQTAANQAEHLAGFARRGAVVPVTDPRADPATLVARTVAEVVRLASDRAARASLSDAGRRLVDGRGALRVAEALR